MAGFIEKRNGRYRARWTPPGGKEINETFDRAGDAEDWLDLQRGDAVRGVWFDPRGGKTLFEDFAKAFYDDQVHLREASLTIEQQHLRLHVLPAFKGRQLRAITRRSVQTWVTSLTKKGLAGWTVHKVYDVLAKILRGAVLDKLIAESPCVEIKLPPVGGKLTIPTKRQLEVVESRLPAPWRRAVSVQAGTGMRGGELLGLTVDRIDFLRRQLVVDRQRQKLPELQRYVDEHGRPPRGQNAVPLGRGFFLVDPKTERSTNRVIPLGDPTIQVLAAQIAEFPPDGVGLVFRNHRGTPVSQQSVSQAWEIATRKRSRIEPERPDEDERWGARDPELEPYFVPHDARHFYASMLIAKGVSVTRVAACLGDTEAVVLRTYSHLWPDDDHAVRAAVDEVLGPDEAPAEGVTASVRPGG